MNRDAQLMVLDGEPESTAISPQELNLVAAAIEEGEEAAH
jgi:hypothetical protein